MKIPFKKEVIEEIEISIPSYRKKDDDYFFIKDENIIINVNKYCIIILSTGRFLEDSVESSREEFETELKKVSNDFLNLIKND